MSFGTGWGNIFCGAGLAGSDWEAAKPVYQGGGKTMLQGAKFKMDVGLNKCCKQLGLGVKDQLMFLYGEVYGPKHI